MKNKRIRVIEAQKSANLLNGKELNMVKAGAGCSGYIYTDDPIKCGGNYSHKACEWFTSCGSNYSDDDSTCSSNYTHKDWCIIA
jgi:hypothetical protein